MKNIREGMESCNLSTIPTSKQILKMKSQVYFLCKQTGCVQDFGYYIIYRTPQIAKDKILWLSTISLSIDTTEKRH